MVRGYLRSVFADGLAVVDRFGIGEQFQVLLDSIGNLEQRVLGRSAGGVRPHWAAAAWAASSASSMSSAVDRAACVYALPVMGVEHQSTPLTGATIFRQ